MLGPRGPPRHLLSASSTSGVRPLFQAQTGPGGRRDARFGFPKEDKGSAGVIVGPPEQ